MKICRVIGSVVSTIKYELFEDEKLLLVQPLDLEGNPQGSDMIAFDKVNAGVGDLVLVIREGGSAAILLDKPELPAHAVVVGVIDRIDFQEKPSGLFKNKSPAG
ncbi:EutN/CcmL family microcompartment protein [candidate division KSB1 bacterium]